MKRNYMAIAVAIMVNVAFYYIIALGYTAMLAWAGIARFDLKLSIVIAVTIIIATLILKNPREQK